jgi:hypothetical protein
MKNKEKRIIKIYSDPCKMEQIHITVDIGGWKVKKNSVVDPCNLFLDPDSGNPASFRLIMDPEIKHQRKINIFVVN